MAAQPLTPSTDTKATITAYLHSKNLPPNPTWLQSFLSSTSSANRPNTPILAQQKTALFRILSTDLTTSVQPSSQSGLLPADVSSPEVKERVLAGPITVQVLDIEDIGRSCWSQVETLEAQERGEMTKGREVIRVVPDEERNNPEATPTPSSTTSGPHKLLLQDPGGRKVCGFELTPIPGIDIQQMSIGAKLVLKNVIVARGVALLEPKGVEVLGGKVEAWDKKWRAERKEVLRRKAGMGMLGGNGDG